MVRLPLRSNFATSFRHASARIKDRYSGNASRRLYDVAKTSPSSASVNLMVSPSYWLENGGSNAEKAGVKLQIVQALSEVGSCCVVLESYAYESSSVINVRYRS